MPQIGTEKFFNIFIYHHRQFDCLTLVLIGKFSSQKYMSAANDSHLIFSILLCAKLRHLPSYGAKQSDVNVSEDVSILLRTLLMFSLLYKAKWLLSGKHTIGDRLKNKEGLV